MDWRYYNHAILPATAPNTPPDLALIKNGEIWKEFKDKKPLLIRWTTDFDCGYETDWWYCIKDNKFDISALNSNNRRKINLGNKYFDVKLINPFDYKEELYEIECLAIASWPWKYRPKNKKNEFIERLEQSSGINFFGAFEKGSNKLVGYATNKDCEEYVEFLTQRVIPTYEKYKINNAIVYGICEFYKDRFNNGFFIFLLYVTLDVALQRFYIHL